MRKPPEAFKEYGGGMSFVMSNFDHTIEKEIEEAIKGEPYWSQYAAWNFYGQIWWENDMWHCLVRCYGTERETISALSLEEIMIEASAKYGED